MIKSSKIILRFVGFASALVALAGFAYTIMYAIALYGEPEINELEHFHIAYCSMVLICVAFYLILLWFGYSFIKLKLNYWHIYPFLFVLEYVYFLAIARLWTLEDESWALSIGAATGVANGGLVIQAFSGIFFWGPLLVLYVRVRSSRNISANKQLNTDSGADAPPPVS